MYASVMPNGKLYLESKPKPGSVDSFEFSMSDLPKPPDPDKQYTLRADFQAHTFYLEEVQTDTQTPNADKIAAMSAACNAAITAGVDVELSDGNTYHYSLTLEDQLNMMNLQAMVASGAESVPYHADGEECRYYSAADFAAIAEAATAWKLYHESYFNSLRSYIQSMTTVEEIEAVTYGMEIPAEYQTDVLKNLTGGVT